MRQMPELKTVVIKIGSNILAGPEGVDACRIEKIARAVAALKEEVPGVVIVSSGAIAAGYRHLGFRQRPKDITDKQAAAAVGQTRLMGYYNDALARHGLTTAQILITKYDFSNRTRYLNARGTITRLLKLGAVPIINENDTVVVNELKYVESFGDNDNLGALVASLIDADLLLILSDVDGLYTADPRIDPEARFISEVPTITSDILKLATGSASAVGTGGMASKLAAAAKALAAGCPVGITGGQDPENILRFIRGEEVGTYFPADGTREVSKKLWISYAAIPAGTVVVDAGAAKAILENHSSLLPSGVIAIRGSFQAGDVVKVVTAGDEAIATGRVRYSAADLERIKRLKSSEAKVVLGRKAGVVIHCDEMGK